MDFGKIKLIIWDMDETFWNGTLSEESVCLSDKNKALIMDLTDIGIVNSICSKNYESQVIEELDKYNLTDYFVFKSINWEAKGNRVKQIITDMQLRNPNVMFIDDNPSNLEEVKFFCPDIMLAGPEIICELIEWSLKQPKNDTLHKRLNQYKVLEEKTVQKKNFNSNEEFLFSSNIKVEINLDCIPVAERIQELVMRSNQLNFTKRRDSIEQILALLKDNSYNNGYVT
ncbi:MAG: HAD-IIIC family phosphatase, partial [Ruminococcus sp.]|nr:HAD-IIIC family phosphatase [Ruminococcus sp.]